MVGKRKGSRENTQFRSSVTVRRWKVVLGEQYYREVIHLSYGTYSTVFKSNAKNRGGLVHIEQKLYWAWRA